MACDGAAAAEPADHDRQGFGQLIRLLPLALLAGCAAPACGPAVTATLFFGLSRPGGVVEAAAFERFLDAQVTPRFPAGLTVLEGAGRWRAPDGRMTQEPSKVVVIVAPRGADTVRRLQAIREAYRVGFGQESVGMALANSCADF